MNAPNRVILLSTLLLVLLPVPVLASCQVVIEHNWSVVGAGGHYGVFQYQTGPGLFDASTAVLLGPYHFQVPAPLFAILAACGLPVVGILALYLRGVFSEPRATNQRGGGGGGMSVQPRIGSPRPAAPHHGCSAAL